jgi:predicted lipoprotein with Yx(FWY)xxD motif
LDERDQQAGRRHHGFAKGKRCRHTTTETEVVMKKVAIAVLGVLVLACSSSLLFAADPTVKVATKEGVGSYLVDGAGKTLYWFTKDSPGKSACEGPCLANWPAFAAASIVVPAGLKAEDFGSITRPEGAPQTTFRGYPLYYWKGDAAVGDTTGQGVNGVWFVVDPGKFPK